MYAMLKHRLMGMVGNILESYDNALFALLAPFLAPLFFCDHDPLTALILTYGMLPLGILARPLGALFFGWIGDLLGRRQALFYSLVGMAVATIGMGCIPTYAEVGARAPLFLASARVIQNFCAAGEVIGGAIYVLEHTDGAKKNFVSAVYDASSMGGILIASAMVTLFSYQGHIENSWRALFWMGGVVAILGILLRLKGQEAMEYIQTRAQSKMSVITLLKTHRLPLLSIILVSGFSYTTYSIAFTLMNGYVPLISQWSKTEVMGINTVLLVVDMMMLPLFGWIATRVNRQKLMVLAALLSMLSAIPLFYLLEDALLSTIVVMRLMIVTMGVAFSATYHAWAQEQVPPAARYTILSLGYALGSQVIGAPTSAICLWLYQKMGWVGAPALYLMVTAALAAFAVRKLTHQEKIALLPSHIISTL